MKEYPPIALFVYNRPSHTAAVLEALCANKGADRTLMYVFSDGAASAEDAKRVEDVRKVVEASGWPGKMKMVNRDGNHGLMKNIVFGIDQVLEEHDTVIVLEDDLITSPGFIDFHRQALELYADTPSVYGVSGYSHPLDLSWWKHDVYFLPFISTWGWSTWRSRWNGFDIHQNYLQSISKLVHREKFDLPNRSFSTMLQMSYSGQNQSWGVRWYAYVFLNGGKFLFPKKSLVRNIGFDGSGTHDESASLSSNTPLANSLEVPFLEPHVDHRVVDLVDRFFEQRLRPKSFIQWVKKSLTRYF